MMVSLKITLFLASLAPIVESVQHLYGCCPEMEPYLVSVRNGTGHVVSRGGIFSEMMTWMSTSFHFRLECIVTVLRTMENSSTEVGSIFYLETGRCDWLVSAAVVRHDRYQHFDYVHPFKVDPVVMVIPRPTSSTIQEYSAVVKPFEFDLWILLAILLAALTAIFIAMDRLGKKDGDGDPAFGYMWFLLFVAILLYKAQLRFPNHLRNRIITGAWGLAVVVISAYYCSVLTSFLVSPGYRPLVDSKEALADSNQAHPAVIKGYGADITITKSEDPVMKKLAVKLNATPRSRCMNDSICIDLVKQGSGVFIHNLGSISVSIMNDYVSTRKCNLALAKNEFGKFSLAWGLAKGSIHLEVFNRGVLRMVETGLIDRWTNRFSPIPHQCFDRKGRSAQIEEFRHPTILNLAQLKSIFVITLIGFLASFSVFIGETTLHFIHL